ncbi:MAG: YcjF family protein [Gammaproteobacteria bacterium]
MAETNTRLERAAAIVKAYMLAAVVIGLVPLPLVGLAALAAIQLKMLHSLANLYESEFSSQLWGSLIASFLGGGIPVIVGGVVRRSIPLVGLVSTSVFAGASTYAIGKVAIQNHESGGTFLTFDSQAVRDYYAQQFEKGKEEVQRFVGVKP